jgi:glycosyltransferase involved in cell wall biosynthesis
MLTGEKIGLRQLVTPFVPVPVSVIVPARNEAKNLPRCLESLRGVGEVYVVDSQSGDDTTQIACSYGAKIVQFNYAGGWPKKRQWAIDTLPLAYDWIFLVDADEALTPQLAEEIARAIQNPGINGYYISLQMFFLGRVLRNGGAGFYKLSLFRRGKGRFECRLKDQNSSMADMEVHEHVIVEGKSTRLKNSLLHHNVESISRYIQKHDEYANWDAAVWLAGESNSSELPPAWFGSQAQRRRWLRKKLFTLPGSSLLLFVYRYIFRRGFLDGIPGLIYCGFQGLQFFHIKAKIYELGKSKS